MTTRFLLLRHAAHDRQGELLTGRMDGVHLGARGRREAQLLAERLRREPIAAIYSSPLPRAVETAAPISRTLHLPIVTAEQLNEIDFGEWTGRPIHALAPDPAWRLWNSRRSLGRAPGGESMLAAQMRVVGFMAELRETNRGRNVLLVSHGDVIRAAIAYYLGLTLDLMLRFEVAPGSLSIVEASLHGTHIALLNERCPV